MIQRAQAAAHDSSQSSRSSLDKLTEIPSISELVRIGKKYVELYPSYSGWQRQPATAHGSLLFQAWMTCHSSRLQQARFLILRELVAAATAKLSALGTVLDTGGRGNGLSVEESEYVTDSVEKCGAPSTKDADELEMTLPALQTGLPIVGWLHVEELQAQVCSKGISRATFLRARDSLKWEGLITRARKGNMWVWRLL